ncbi:unnamed protein product [Orchesella dallaii]|uniref:Uncharacterized protein n=1 Tax=Orchesella dallaii TaxID=48710 RepID=A0ABP1QP18_9HEXA
MFSRCISYGRSSRRVVRKLALAYRSNYFRSNSWLGWLEIFARFVLIPGAAIGLLVYLSFFVYEKYFGPPAVITISFLDVKEDVNFPDKEINSRSFNTTVVWKVDRFNYIEHFPENRVDILGRFAKFPSGKNLDTSGWGFWIHKNGPSSSTTNKTESSGNGDEEEYVYADLSISTASIRAMRIMEHLTSSGVSPEELEVAVGIRAYLDGEAMIVIRFQDGITQQVEGRRLSRSEFGSKGFCYKILDDVPFDRRIDMIQILPTTASFQRHSIAIVDQVVIVVANRGISESIIHTLIPSGWC